ncbi:MAG: triosephosphate isomerase [Patescibacteria group bacterium]|nr:triosephosphate isomerase [Patescibacteria group bacterium]
MSKLIIANWKSNKTQQSALEWCQKYNPPNNQTVEIIVAPSFPLLTLVREHLPASIKLAAQDVSSFPMGSYTGAVNAQQLADVSVTHCIVGHSERRKYFHETHQDVAAKIAQLVTNNIAPILCLDEEYLEAQADALESKDIPNLVVAYEPLSAIGSGNNAPVDQVTRVIEKIHQIYGTVPVIYGGSVDERSVNEYLLVSDGVLVGGASLEAEQFSKVVAAAQG